MVSILSGWLLSLRTSQNLRRRKRFSDPSWFRLFPNPVLDVVNIASENILQQRLGMSERMKQLEAAVEVPVQSDAVAAKLALANAEQIMIHEHAREMKRVVDLHHKTYTAKDDVYEDQFKCPRDAWEQLQRLQIFHESGDQERPVQSKAMSAIAERGL